jgi:ParB family chromosome partitioning protein
MSAKKSALGKGLGALIPEANDREEYENENKNLIKEVDVNKIVPNEDQPRKSFDEDKLASLSESIKENGIIQPIVVIKENEFFKIVAGERRWRAAKLAGIKKVPIIEKNLNDKEVMELSLIENLQREDLNPIEEAEAYKKLMEEFNLTQEAISVKVGKSRPVITNSLRLLNLDDKVKQYIIESTISEGHGRVLLTISNKELQYEVAQKIIDDGLNVRQTEKLIKEIENKKNSNKKQIKKDIYIKEMEDRLKTALGTKVYISKGKKKGKIEIEYYTQEDLERLIEMLNA